MDGPLYCTVILFVYYGQTASVDALIIVLVYRCLDGLAPPYLASDLLADLDDRRRLRSSLTDALNVPSTRLSTIGDCAFLVAAARMEQFAGDYHIVAISADIQETTQDKTVCSQLSRLLAAATSDTCSFFFFSHRSHVSFTLFFCKVSSKSLTLCHLNLFV